MTDPHADPDDAEIFEPSAEDVDHDAEQQMQQGRGPENALYDPWFAGPHEAQHWTPEEGA